jgi:hypothetical protein
MQRSYSRFGESERRLIGKWLATILAFYGVVLFVLVALAVGNQSASNLVASATQAGISTQKSQLTTEFDVAHSWRQESSSF